MTVTLVTLLLLNGLIYGVKRTLAGRGTGVLAAPGVGYLAGSFAQDRSRRSVTNDTPPRPASVYHSPRYLTAMRLNRGLRGSPMARLGFELEAAGWRYHVSPYVMAGIAATESSLGRARCGYNAWGLGSCGSAWQVPAFRNWHEAIFYMARFLRSHWPSARTVYDLRGYAACSSCWAAKTAGWMRSLFGVGPEVRYP